MTGSQPVVLNRFTISASRNIIAMPDFLGNRWFCDMEENRIAVYLGTWDDDSIFPRTFVPEERSKQLFAMRNSRRKKEMEAVWSLLSYALGQEGISLEQIHPRLLPSGKWIGNDVNFSLSHEGKHVAVALSNHPIGIDIVLNNDRRLSDQLRQHISTSEELASDWTTGALFAAKEAVFKRDGGSGFAPSTIDVLREKERVFAAEIADMTMALASSLPIFKEQIVIRSMSGNEWTCK